MNQPAGLRPDAAGKVRTSGRSTCSDASTGYEFFAYVGRGVHGRPASWSPRCTRSRMLRGRATATTGSGFIDPFTVAAIFTPIQLSSATSRPGDLRRPAGQVRGDGVHLTSRRARPDREARRDLHGRRRVSAGIGIPASIRCSSASAPTPTFTGLNPVPEGRSATRADAAPSRLRHDGGSARRWLVPARGLVRGHLVAEARPTADEVVPARRRRSSGVAAVLALECGWIVTEVGRQPWIVTASCARPRRSRPPRGSGGCSGDDGALHRPRHRWPVVLRGLRERWSKGEANAARGSRTDRRPPRRRRRRREQRRRLRRDPLDRRHPLRGLRRRRLRRRRLGPARGPRRAAARRAADRPLDRAGLGGQPRLADLRPRRALDRVPDRLLGDHDHALHPAGTGRLGIVLRGSGFAFRHALPGPVQRPATRVFGVASLLTPFFMGTVVGAIASGECPAAGDGDPTGSWTGFLPLVTGALFVAVAAYTAAVFLVRDSGAAGDEDLPRLLRAPRPGVRRWSPASPPWRRHRPSRGRPLHLRRTHLLARDRARRAVGGLRAGRARAARDRAEPPACGSRRSGGGRPDLGLLRRGRSRTCSHLADDLRGRRRVRHADRGDRRLPGRRGAR